MNTPPANNSYIMSKSVTQSTAAKNHPKTVTLQNWTSTI
jgi:hypothetical protein